MDIFIILQETRTALAKKFIASYINDSHKSNLSSLLLHYDIKVHFYIHKLIQLISLLMTFLTLYTKVLVKHAKAEVHKFFEHIMSRKHSVTKRFKRFHFILSLSKYMQNSSLHIYFLCYHLKQELKHNHQLFGYRNNTLE